RWLSATANLTLLLGVASLLIGQARGLFRASTAFVVAISGSFVLLTLFNGHRSVWLATIVACLTTIVLFRPSAKQVAVTATMLGTAATGAIFWMTSQVFSISEYVTTRLVAFTNSSADPDSYWRMFLWLQAIERIAAQPFGGPGFGEHFQLISPTGEVITTSPHNFYITVAYHGGLIGLS